MALTLFIGFFFLCNEWTTHNYMDRLYCPTLQPHTTHPRPLVSWKPPSHPSIKVIDDSSTTSLVAASFIIRNCMRLYDNLHSQFWEIFDPYSRELKTMALLNNLNFASSKGFVNIEIEEDDLMVINIIKCIYKPPWKIQHLMREVIYIMTKFNKASITHIYREANSTTDWVANVGHLLSNCM